MPLRGLRGYLSRLVALLRLLPAGKHVGRISAAVTVIIVCEVGNGEAIQVTRLARLLGLPARLSG